MKESRAPWKPTDHRKLTLRGENVYEAQVSTTVKEENVNKVGLILLTRLGRDAPGVAGMALNRKWVGGSSLHLAAQIGLVTELNFTFQIISMSIFF